MRLVKEEVSGNCYVANVFACSVVIVFLLSCCRGYQMLGANVTRYEGGFQRDWHEGIDLYKEEEAEDVKVSMLVLCLYL